MFAELHYEAGASIVNLNNDIAAILTGSTIAALSASVNKSNSTLDNSASVGGAATWELVGSSTSVADFIHAYTNQSYASFGGNVLRQIASTSFGGNQYKYIKTSMVYGSATPTVIHLAIGMGKGQSNGVMSGASKQYAAYTTVIGGRASGGTTFSDSMYVQIYSSPSATLINIARSDRFSYVPVLAVLDFAPASPKLNVAGNLCTLITSCGPANTTSPNAQDYYAYIAETTVNGQIWSTPTTNGTASAVFIGTPELSNYFQFAMQEMYKFSGFSKIGSKFDLHNIGMTKFNCNYYDSVAGQIWYTNDLLLEQIPYSSITDISGVYGCNRFAFGNNGDVFQTPVGNMCKFGPFMVKVA